MKEKMVLKNYFVTLCVLSAVTLVSSVLSSAGKLIIILTENEKYWLYVGATGTVRGLDKFPDLISLGAML
jgi:hypothetical protein